MRSEFGTNMFTTFDAQHGNARAFLPSLDIRTYFRSILENKMRKSLHADHHRLPATLLLSQSIGLEGANSLFCSREK